MDYIKLKRTLMAAFDHFLSCHDFDELEQMMQAFEVGKSLVIRFPEPINREDYKNDVLAYEEKNFEASLKRKKVTSRVRRRKVSTKSVSENLKKQIEICNIPIFMDLSALSKKKQQAVLAVMRSDKHQMTLGQLMVRGRYAFAMAKICKVIPQDISPMPHLDHMDNKNPLWGQSERNKVESSKSDERLREKLIKKIKAQLRKQRHPP